MMTNKIDLGFLTDYQLEKIIEHVRRSHLDIVEIHILKVKDNMSCVLEFRTKKEATEFDENSHELVKQLRGDKE